VVRSAATRPRQPQRAHVSRKPAAVGRTKRIAGCNPPPAVSHRPPSATTRLSRAARGRRRARQTDRARFPAALGRVAFYVRGEQISADHEGRIAEQRCRLRGETRRLRDTGINCRMSSSSVRVVIPVALFLSSSAGGPSRLFGSQYQLRRRTPRLHRLPARLHRICVDCANATSAAELSASPAPEISRLFTLSV
jgi:hypothetical protein